MSGRRVYVGKLPPDVRQEDVEKLFRDFKIRECRLMAGFGFIEFEEQRDAEEAVTKYDGAKLLGEPIMVEFAKERRPREAGGDFRGPPGGGGGAYGAPGGGAYGAPGGAPRRGPGVKVLLKGVGSDVSWQDLKDFGREAGRPLRSDVDRATGDGFLEYGTQEEAQSAVEKLSTMEIRGRRPEVTIDTSAPAPRESYGGGDRGYGGDRGGDRYGGDRGGDRYGGDRGGDRYGGDRGGDRYGGDRDRGGDRGGYSSRREYEPRDRSPPRRERDSRPYGGGDDYRSSRGGGDREYGRDDRRDRRDEPPRRERDDRGDRASVPGGSVHIFSHVLSCGTFV
ncbi:hypothetical protein QFC22_005103 [Naganishia vaughanmartiniae]|uniref:Uncharacterized protein n=1 Tax=Naganishia vaughanmartiniae TaxID=1424756 RepID=A0ACC2WW16_9TREE|nr:hypothetical protein QFC22_005103 [Naganishia vaughanmartiniae]